MWDSSGTGDSEDATDLKIDRRAKVVKKTILAVWFSSVTDSAAVEDQAVGESRPLLRRQQFHQILLNLIWIFLFCQAQAVRKSLAMSIDDDPGDAERMP